MPERDIKSLTSELVAIPSLTRDQEACLKALDCVSAYLGEAVPNRTFESNGVISRLWGDGDTLMSSRLLLAGHIDVVDVEGDNSLFIARESGGKLFGRGSGDMKGHLASMLHAYKKWFYEAGSRGVGLLITSDEEAGGFNGTRHVIEQGLKPNVVFIPDGSFDFSIVRSQKAPYHFRAESVGEGGHASLSYRIKNPIDSLIAFYAAVREKYHLATPENAWASTFTMSIINTDNRSKNKIPDKVVAAFDWRFPLEQVSFTDGKQEIFELAKRFGVRVLEARGGGEGCLIDKDADYVRKWKTSIEGVIGHEVGFVNTDGATDGRHFYNSETAGTKNVLITSAKVGNLHEKEEWVDIQSLYQLSDALSRYMITLE